MIESVGWLDYLALWLLFLALFVALNYRFWRWLNAYDEEDERLRDQFSSVQIELLPPPGKRPPGTPRPPRDQPPPPPRPPPRPLDDLWRPPWHADVYGDDQADPDRPRQRAEGAAHRGAQPARRGAREAAGDAG